MKKNDDLKQSKISRHQVAKQKFRFFQRSLSCKSLNNKGDFIPGPGQFAILTNHPKKKLQGGSELPNIHLSQKKIQPLQNDLKFTTNLKLITKQRSPSRVSQLLNETVNIKIDEKKSLRKIVKSESSGNLRPLTAISSQLANDLQGKNNLNESKIITNAAQYDRKYYLKKQYSQGNTFIVKSKSGIPRHAYGHKSIRLTQDGGQKRLKIQSNLNQQAKKFTKIPINEQQQQSQLQGTQKANFLPIEYYIIDDKKPEQLIQKYKLKENFMVGYSKWHDLEGQFEWRKCRIIDYIKEKQRWEIEWLHNGKKKLVARNNLFFQKENYQSYQKTINDAQNFRKISEVYMKYNWIIDNLKTETHILEENQIGRILKLVTSKQVKDQNHLKSEISIQSLIRQIKDKYIRANHIVQFNASLPFNPKYKEQFRGYLPQRYFNSKYSLSKFTPQKPILTHKQNKSSEGRNNILLSDEQNLSRVNTKVHPSVQLRKYFQANTKKFHQNTSLSSINRIHIIQFLNETQFQIKNQRISSPYQINIGQRDRLASIELKFFSFYSKKTYVLSDVSSRIQNSLFESISKMNNVVCDVEYFVGKQLDPLYLQKKAYGNQDFQTMIETYRKFLSLVNMRTQNIGRQILFGMLRQLEQLITFDTSILSTQSSSHLYQKLQMHKKFQPTLKIHVKLQIKAQNIQCTPKRNQITEVFINYTQKLIEEFSNISCIRKSYIEDLRPKNKMKIIQSLQQGQDSRGQEDHVWKTHSQLLNIKQDLIDTVNKCGQFYERFYNEIRKMLESVLILQSDIKRKTSKKCNFSQIQEFINNIKIAYDNLTNLKFASVNTHIIFKTNCDNSNNNLSEDSLENQRIQTLMPDQPKFVKIGIFCFNIQDFLVKIESKLYDVSLELYKLMVQKIGKDTQKLQKTIDSIIEKLEKQPMNIKQMIVLEQYINEEASQESLKICTKINQLHGRFSLLQKLNIEIEYKDFYECHKVYMKPSKVKTIMNQRLRSIQTEYKKVFGQGLMRETVELIGQIKETQQKFYASIQINSIQEMDSSFLVFSKLKERIEAALSKSAQVNQYEGAMKWINTNFQRLTEIKKEFLPYYQLISLQKNYRFHIEVQLTQCLQTIDANRISQEVLLGCEELSNLETNIFYKNSIILQIVKQVGQSYKLFRDKLPLLQILRNSDLRQRHWVSIKQLTGFNDILSEKITYQELQQRQIKKYQKRLIQISHIATRQLIYEKRLNKMKKQWKEMKILMTKVEQNKSENSNLNELKIISNLDEIQVKTQNDIYQIQQILSSSFIKFLQKDIVNWSNLTLYKMYEFIEIWRTIERQIIQMHNMFRKSSMQNQANAQYLKFKALEKNWKNITNQIEQQPNILQLLQTKINQSLKYTIQLIEDLKKSINHFFQKKKQRFSRFGSLSQQQLISLFSNSDKKQIFDQAVRKCLHGVKNVVRNQSKIITCVKTHLDQVIQFKEDIQSSRDGDNMTPDKVIQDIQRRIKNSLRNSIQDMSEEKSAKILQIILFHQRIIFTRQIQNQLFPENEETQSGINQGYLNALLGLKSKIIQALFKEYIRIYQNKNKTKKEQKLIKIQAELNQLINHIEIAENLYTKEVRNIHDFDWLSQIRTYQKNKTYLIQIGLNILEYGFQIIDQQNFIVEQNTSKTFFNISMAMKERMFSILTGNIGSGKLATYHYLASIHGKNEYVLNCHKALSYDNIFDFFRMAANGIWIVFNSLNLLSNQVFSCFRQSSQLFWVNYPTVKNKNYFTLGDKSITFNTHEIGLFGTINISKSSMQACTLISEKLSTYFRNLDIVKLDIRYVLQCKLVLAGFEYCSNTNKFIKMIQMIKEECERYYEAKENERLQIYKSLTFSKLNFIQKVVYFAKQYKDQYNDQNIDDYLLLQLGLNKSIEEITKNLDFLKAQILQKLNRFFNFIVKLPIKANLSDQNQNSQPGSPNLSNQKGDDTINQHDELVKQDIKRLFLDKKLFSNRQIINHYFQIIKTLKQKHSIIILGSCSTGKSTMIDLLSDNQIIKEDRILQEQQNKTVYVDNFKINLHYVHPNAYSLQQLYGDSQKNGIVNCLIKQSYEALYKQKTGKTIQGNQTPFTNVGIVFDSQVNDWIQPLLPLIKNCSNYVQANGKNMIIEHPIKLIFQCRDLSSVSPSVILSTNIVQLQNYQLKWQNIFTHYLKKNFKDYYQKKVFLDFCELLVTFIMEPVLQFFKSSITNSASKNSLPQFSSESHFVSQIYQSYLKNQINYIPLIFNLFIALTDDYFGFNTQSDPSKTSNEKRKPESHLLQIFSNPLNDQHRSAILNIFLMSITWTIGLFIPEESKKTFSRHFKYLTKRAIQLNIKGIQKDSLPKDDQDIYEICYMNSKWHSWQSVPQNERHKKGIDNQIQKDLTAPVSLRHKIKYLYFLQKYCQSELPFFILGKSSTGKNSLMLNFLNSRSNQTYNKILVACTSNSSHLSLKRQLKLQIERQKYSHTFKGFVHGKVTLFYLCDMNLPLLKEQSSVDQFLHNYIKSKGWYLDTSSQFFEFKNINLCGTMNSSVKFSQHLLKYLNPLPYFESQSDVRANLFSILSANHLLSAYKQNITNLMTNLQQVVSRELKSKLKISGFTLKDLCDIAQKVSFKVSTYLVLSKQTSENMIPSQVKLDQSFDQKSCKNKILKCWIDQTQKKYLQKFGSNYDKQKIFYFINNVLMEEERLRYKSVMPSDSVFICNLPYFIGKLKVSDKENYRKPTKIAKTFLTLSSYKIYQNLNQIQPDIAALETLFQRSNALYQVQDNFDSLSDEIKNSLLQKKDLTTVTQYIKAMTSMLDHIAQNNSHLICMIDDVKTSDSLLIDDANKFHAQSSLKQIFSLKPCAVKITRNQNKDNKKLSKLLHYVCKVSNCQLLEYQRNPNVNDSRLDWKIFINELFELINSPTSSNLREHYVIYLQNVTAPEEFILEDLIKLKRTGTLSMLDDFLNNEEIEIDETLQNQNLYQKSQQDIQRDSQGYIQSNKQLLSLNNRKKALAQRKKQLDVILKRNTAQMIKQKILKKIKFVICLDEEKVQKWKKCYSILFEKCHILWASNLEASSSTSPVLNSSQKQIKKDNPISLESRDSIQMDSEKSLSEMKDQSIKKPKQKLQSEYIRHKFILNHFLALKDVKELYLNLQSQTRSKQQVKKIQGQISSQSNIKFLQFLNLIQIFKLGIETKINNRIFVLNTQYNYFSSLSQNFIAELSQIINRKQNSLDSKQIQLKALNSCLEKLSAQNDKFLNYFAKSGQAIEFLQKQSNEANELYNSYMAKEVKLFTESQNQLIQLLKNGKDKKIILTNQMKLYLETFGFVIGKKIKPEESMIKEIIKDINALKVHKKVINMTVQHPLAEKLNEKTTIISENSSLKLKQFIAKNIQPQFNQKIQILSSKEGLKNQMKDYSKMSTKQASFSENLINLLKEYFISLGIYFNKSQDQAIKMLNKKCSKCLKQLSKTRDQYAKSQKGKPYQKLRLQLETNHKNQKILLESYSQDKKQHEDLIKVQKKCIQIVCLNMNGQFDEKQLATKQITDKQLLNSLPSGQKMNIVIQRIKADYNREKVDVKVINNCKDIIAFILAIKFSFYNHQSIDTNLFHKTLSKQALDTMKTIRLDLWASILQDSGQLKTNEQAFQLQKMDIFQYFIKSFHNVSALNLTHGMVFLQKGSLQVQSWISNKKGKYHLKFDNYTSDKLSNVLLEVYKPQSNQIDHSAREFFISVQLKSTMEVQSLKNQIFKPQNNSIRDFLTTNPLFILCQKSIMQAYQSSLLIQSSKYPNDQINNIFFTSSPKKIKIIAEMENRFEEQLCQQKKQSDIKLITKYKQLKQSQKQNLAERKEIIKNQSWILGFLHSFSLQNNKNVLESNVLTFKIAQNRPDPAKTTQQRMSLMKQIDDHFSRLKQNFLEYTSINQNLQSHPNMSNLKKRANVHTTKLVNYFTRVYQGLQILQAQNLILCVNSVGRFSNFVLWVIQKQKQLHKTPNAQSKLFKSIRNKIFEHFLTINNDKKIFIGLVFAMAGQQTLTEKQYEKLVRLISRLYKFSIRILETDIRILNEFNNGCTKKLQKKNCHKMYFIDNYVLKRIEKNTLSQPRQVKTHSKFQKLQISQEFQQFLDILSETFTSFKDLKHNFKRKIQVWISFLQNIESKFSENFVNTLPEPYNDINRSYFGLFIALVEPQNIQDWLNTLLVEEDLMKIGEVGNLSNDARILKVGRLNFKQTILIGDSGVRKLYDLAFRTRKQIKLYSKLQVEKKRKILTGSPQTSFKNSLTNTKKQIPLNQISFFNNRKLEQQFIEQLYQSMKNSAWLVIDVQNFTNFSSNSSQLRQFDSTRLDLIVKLIDLYTSQSKQNENQEQAYEEATYNMLSETSQKNLPAARVTKNQFNSSTFQNFEYQIFFVFPESMKKQALKNSFMQNYQRCVLEISLQNQVQRYMSLPQLYYEELLVSKKVIKDYENLDLNVKKIIYYILTLLKKFLMKVLAMNHSNMTLLTNTGINSLLNFGKLEEIVEKISKLMIIIILQPQFLTQIISSSSKRVSTQITEKTQSKQQQQKQALSRQKNQTKTNSRFHRQKLPGKRQSRKSSSVRQNSQNKDISIDSNIQAGIRTIQSKKQSETKLLNNLEHSKLMDIIRLVQSYLQSSFDKKQRQMLGFSTVWQNQIDCYFPSLQIKKAKFDIERQNAKRVDDILRGGANKAFSTSNKSILENVFNYVKQNQDQLSQDKIKSIKSVYFSQKNTPLQSSAQNSFMAIRLFMQRLIKLNPKSLWSQNLTQRILSLIEVKRNCELQLVQIRKMLSKEQMKNNSNENSSNSQFTFSSLTQNLTIDQMRKKLMLNKKNSSEQTSQIRIPSSCQKMNEYLFKRKEADIKRLQQNIVILKSLKQVFLLEKINYPLLLETWNKIKKDNSLNQIQSLLTNLDRHGEAQVVSQNDSMLYLANPQNLNMVNFGKKSQIKASLLFNLDKFSHLNELTKFIQILKELFADANKLRPPNVKHHLILEQMADQKRIMNATLSTYYKICSFQGFIFYNCQKIDSTLPKCKMTFSLNNQIGFKKGSSNTKLSLYFEERNDESDSESDLDSQDFDPDNKGILDSKKSKNCIIPFYLNRMNGVQSQKSFEQKNQHSINISIEVQNNDKIHVQKCSNAFIYY